MATQTIVQSVNQTLRDEMRRNGNMVISAKTWGGTEGSSGRPRGSSTNSEGSGWSTLLWQRTP